MTIHPNHHSMQELPHNLEAEQAVLGTILHGGASPSEIRLTEEDFSEPLHGRIWRTMIEVSERKGLVSPVGLRTYLDNDEALQQIGGLQYLIRLSGVAATVFDVHAYVDLVKDAAVRRLLLAAGAKIQALALDPKPDIPTAHEAIRIGSEIIDLATRRSPAVSGLIHVSKDLEFSVEEVRYAIANPGWIPGQRFGFNGVDVATGGIEPGEVAILAARPSMGKTAIAGQIALNVSGAFLPLGHPDAGTVAFYSIEMGKKRIDQRMISAIVRDRGTGMQVPYKDARIGRINRFQFQEFEKASEIYGSLPIFIDDASSRSPADICAGLRALVRRATQESGSPVRLAIVDHLGLLDSDKNPDNRTLQLGAITRDLKRTAKDLGIAILLLCQLNRQVESRDNKRPTKADLRQSGEIEENADIIMFIYRAAYYAEVAVRAAREKSPDDQADAMAKLDAVRNLAELIIDKSRNGEVTTIDLLCDIACGSFWEDVAAAQREGSHGF